MRILSLLPSATEIVYALGLGDDLVGVSHECDYPEQARSKPVVSTSTPAAELRSDAIHSAFSEHAHASHSLYRIDEQLLKKIDPDVILTQELCTVCAIPVAQVREAARILAGPRRVVSLEPNNLRQILENIAAVAEVTGRGAEAAALIAQLESRIARIRSATASVHERPNVFCMEWMDPAMAGGHWIPEMIRIAGGTDGLGSDGEPSTAIEWERVAEFAPQIMVIMPCGYKIARSLGEVDALTSRPGFFDLPAVKAGQVYIVDSPAFFSRPGPRIVDGLEILAQIIHPEIFLGMFSTGGSLKLSWDKTQPIRSQTLSKRFLPL
jgi:iron complex transport system substrate-binding protein